MEIEKIPTPEPVTRIVYIDVVDICNLKCPTCVRGVGGLRNGPSKAKLEEFKSIVQKARANRYTQISLFNWTEPFLSKDLTAFVQIVREFGLQCAISSNLSSKNSKRIKDVLLANPDELIVSISGISQETYEINHKGGDIELVKKNLDAIADLKRNGQTSTRIILRYIGFSYNVSEQEDARNFAETRGLAFEIITGVGDPRWKPGWIPSESKILKGITSAKRNPYEEDQICPLVAEAIPIDSTGIVYQCCAYPNYKALEIGRYLDMPDSEIFLKRHYNRMCWSCNWPRRKMTSVEFAAIQNQSKKWSGLLGQIIRLVK